MCTFVNEIIRTFGKMTKGALSHNARRTFNRLRSVFRF